LCGCFFISFHVTSYPNPNPHRSTPPLLFFSPSKTKTGLRRIIREATYVERFLRIPPEMGMGEQPCVFLPDRHFDYTRVLFYGRELDLLLMNILAYSLFDVWFGNTATSVLLTFLLDFMFCVLRRRLGLANIANKTLIGACHAVLLLLMFFLALSENLIHPR
jgi:Meckelin (Transmembrane protein 67)